MAPGESSFTLQNPYTRTRFLESYDSVRYSYDSKRERMERKIHAQIE